MNVRDLTRNDILNAVGLETRKTAADYILPAIGVFATGMLVGAGLGMLFAPRPGRELRNGLGKRMSNLKERAVETINGRPQGERSHQELQVDEH